MQWIRSAPLYTPRCLVHIGDHARAHQQERAVPQIQLTLAAYQSVEAPALALFQRPT